MSSFSSFLRLNQVLLCGWVTFCLSVHPSMDTVLCAPFGCFSDRWVSSHQLCPVDVWPFFGWEGLGPGKGQCVFILVAAPTSSFPWAVCPHLSGPGIAGGLGFGALRVGELTPQMTESMLVPKDPAKAHSDPKGLGMSFEFWLCG